MVTCLADTNIIIDLLRGHEPAKLWLAKQGTPAVCRMVYMEVVQGATSRQNLRDAMRLLKRFSMVEHTQADFIWATKQLTRHSLAFGIDVADALIAAPAHRLQLPLYTRNTKHFLPLLGDGVQQPY